VTSSRSLIAATNPSSASASRVRVSNSVKNLRWKGRFLLYRTRALKKFAKSFKTQKSGMTVPMVESPDQRRRSWIRLVEWASVIGCTLAIIGFFGFPTFRSLLPINFAFPKFNMWSWNIQPPQRKPPTQQWRPPSDLSGQSWAFIVDTHEVRLDFKDDNTVAFSDPIFGMTGRWTSMGRNYVRIETPSRTIMGVLTTDGEGMTAIVYRQDGQKSVPEANNVIVRRIR
jgi:hypothetical protein